MIISVITKDLVSLILLKVLIVRMVVINHIYSVNRYQTVIKIWVMIIMVNRIKVDIYINSRCSDTYIQIKVKVYHSSTEPGVEVIKDLRIDH